MLGYRKEGGHDCLSVAVFSVRGFAVLNVFSALDHCTGPKQARFAFDFFAQSFPGMDCNRMDSLPGMGGETRRSRHGEVTSAP